MQHKVIIASFAGRELAFSARNLEQYFQIQKPYQLPHVSPHIKWIQNLKGRCISLFTWWSVLRSIDINGFDAPAHHDVDSVRYALLYALGDMYVGFPIDEVKHFRVIDDAHIGRLGGSGHDGIRGTFDGLIWLDPQIIFQQASI